MLRPDGILVVMEWGWERFDAATARWCFDRLADAGGPRLAAPAARRLGRVGRPWDVYFPAWAADHGLHPGRDVVAALDARFHRRLYAEGPYCFPDLAGVTYADEQAAIDAGADPGGRDPLRRHAPPARLVGVGDRSYGPTVLKWLLATPAR